MIYTAKKFKGDLLTNLLNEQKFRLVIDSEITHEKKIDRMMKNHTKLMKETMMNFNKKMNVISDQI